MPHLAKALELYPLDGHVTEHIGLLCDRAVRIFFVSPSTVQTRPVSQSTHKARLSVCPLAQALYRNLSVFESNAHRACCMHARRAAPLRPVLRQLNKNIFPGLYKVRRDGASQTSSQKQAHSPPQPRLA